MRRDFLSILRCPISNNSLEVEPIEVAYTSEGQEIIRTGILWSVGGYWYPIINCVPLMLVFRTPLLSSFERKHLEVIQRFQAKAPDLQPERGERSVQTTFTEEWGGLEDDALSFVYDAKDLVALHRDVWLQMSITERNDKRSILDVGCGFGKEAIVLSELFPNAMIVGADLNLALLKAGHRLATETRVKPVVASLFHLPFDDGAFDHVHCQGVLHHTWSTKAGFDSIEAKVSKNGTLFVWVYAAEDRYVVHGLRGFLVRLYWNVSHKIFRPVLSRSPSFARNAVVHLISIPMHVVIRNRGRNKGTWKYSNTVHGIRDAFTPRYAHEHGFNEVHEWFENASFKTRSQKPGVYRQLFGSRLVGVGFVGMRSDQILSSHPAHATEQPAVLVAM